MFLAVLGAKSRTADPQKPLWFVRQEMVAPDKGEDSVETLVPGKVIAGSGAIQICRALRCGGERGSEGQPRRVLLRTEEEDLNVGGGEGRRILQAEMCEQKPGRWENIAPVGKGESLECLWRIRCQKERGGKSGWSRSGKSRPKKMGFLLQAAGSHHGNKNKGGHPQQAPNKPTPFLMTHSHTQ